MKRLVEGPLTIVGASREAFVALSERFIAASEAFVAEGEAELVVNKAAYFLRRPFDGVHVEIGARTRQFQLCGLLCVDDVVVSLGMDTHMDDVRIETNMFHDVDLAAPGPPAIGPTGRSEE